MSIHPAALVDSKAKIGVDVTIGPFAFVDREVTLGDGCVVGPHAVLHRYTTVGPGCRIHAGAVLGDLPQDVAFHADAVSHVRVGAKCIIREGVTIHRGTKPDTATVVGDGCFLMVNSHLGHNVVLGHGVLLANGVLLGGYVEVGDRAFISGNTGVHQFCRIGRLAMVSGNAGLSKDVPPFCSTRAVTLNRVVGLNVVGMRRAGMTSEERREVKKAFGIVARSGLNVSQAVEAIKREFSGGPALEFASFIESSKRGICRMVGAADDAADGS